MIKKTALTVLFFVACATAQNETIELTGLARDQVVFGGFTLDQEREVRIHCIGAGGEQEVRRITNYQEDPFNLFAYAWILNAKTREMVWRMDIANSSSDWWNKYDREFEGTVRLPKGEYELYFTSIKPSFSSGFLSFERLWEKIIGDDDWWDDRAGKWKIEVSGVDAVLSEVAVEKYRRALKERAVVELTPVGDKSYLNRGFSIDKPLNVEVYALGEGYKGEMFDYGWLMNADSRRKVWEMREHKSSHAGGAIKNRITRTRLRLEPGNYMLYYKSDDNHSSDEWNANPPYDPSFWGVTLFASDKDYDPSAVSSFAEAAQQPLVSIVRMGDSEYEEEGLIVEQAGRFRVYAVGEGDDGRMYDYGWISEVKTGRRVWEMEFYKTDHAGGADKNRQVDEVLFLEKGEYILHYRTDGSHSYEDWNASRPYRPEMWGISLFPLDEEARARATAISTLKSENVLAELTRIGDDEHARKQFRLDETARVRVYAIGEGDWDEMYDYGWIEDESTGRRVWRMRYRNTDHAGGARKNRLVDTVVTLEPGVYSVHFISDDSHSYNKWNATMPDRPKDWGITLYKITP